MVAHGQSGRPRGPRLALFGASQIRDVTLYARCGCCTISDRRGAWAAPPRPPQPRRQSRGPARRRARSRLHAAHAGHSRRCHRRARAAARPLAGGGALERPGPPPALGAEQGCMHGGWLGGGHGRLLLRCAVCPQDYGVPLHCQPCPATPGSAVEHSSRPSQRLRPVMKAPNYNFAVGIWQRFVNSL
jgi:hypothetical protein